MKSYYLLSILFINSIIESSAQIPFNFGSGNWKYYINVSSPQSPPNYGSFDWKSPSYNTTVDPVWQVSATAPLGYSYSTLGTVIIPGALPANKPLVSYYRQTITVPSLSSFTSLTINSVRDDGIVIYLNGVEVFRDNMPSSTSVPNPLATTQASDCVGLVGSACSITNVNAPSFTISGSTLSSILSLNPTPNNLTITAEVHQFPNVTGSPLLTSSSDSYFDLSITGVSSSSAPTITRGPYLQLASDGLDAVGTIRKSEITKQFRWKTDIACKGAVKLWRTSSGIGTAIILSETSAVIDHQLNTSNLIENNNYEYQIGYIDASLAFQILDNNILNKFLTGPTSDTNISGKKTRIWVTGDFGYNPLDYVGQAYAPATTNYVKVRDLVFSGFNTWYNANIGPEKLDFWMLLGDNAYLQGIDNEYQTNFFNPFQSSAYMKQATMISAPGNHEYYESRLNTTSTPSTSNTYYSYIGTEIVDRNSRNYSYYSIFKTPQKGQSGGTPSNHPNFYSYDYANIHFVSLDTYGAESNIALFEDGSPQLAWLISDLNQNDLKVQSGVIKWTVVFFHHPPYTKGSYDSDQIRGVGGASYNASIHQAVANKVIKELDLHRVDLVLNGHSHVYERSKPLKGLYDPNPVSVTYSTTNSSYKPHLSFNASVNNTSTSSGKFDGSTNSCPYQFLSSQNGNQNGIMFATVGSGGTVQSPSTLIDAGGHSAMQHKNYTLGGSMYMELEKNRLTAKWIDQNGSVSDQFTIFKDINSTNPTVNIIHQNELPAQSPALQTLTTPTHWSSVSPIFYLYHQYNGLLTGPTSASTINVATPDIGPTYTITDQTGCLRDKYRFTFNGSCWGNVTINNKFYPTPSPEYVYSSGTITSTSQIKNLANVSFIAKNANHLVTTGSGILFQAELGAIFSATINPSIICPPAGL
jgi:hypothetical protein